MFKASGKVMVTVKGSSKLREYPFSYKEVYAPVFEEVAHNILCNFMSKTAFDVIEITFSGSVFEIEKGKVLREEKVSLREGRP